MSRQQPVWFLQDSPRLKIVVDKNRFGSKIDPVRTGSNRFQRFRLLDNQNISSTSHVPANLFPIMSHLHESWFKTHQTDFLFSDSNNRLFNAYLKCSNKKHLKNLNHVFFQFHENYNVQNFCGGHGILQDRTRFSVILRVVQTQTISIFKSLSVRGLTVLFCCRHCGGDLIIYTGYNYLGWALRSFYNDNFNWKFSK